MLSTKSSTAAVQQRYVPIRTLDDCDREVIIQAFCDLRAAASTAVSVQLDTTPTVHAGGICRPDRTTTTRLYTAVLLGIAGCCIMHRNWPTL